MKRCPECSEYESLISIMVVGDSIESGDRVLQCPSCYYEEELDEVVDEDACMYEKEEL